MKADFCALADRLSPSVQRARKERASTAFRRVIGKIGAAKSGCVVIASASLHNRRSILSMTRKRPTGSICCGRACGGWTNEGGIKAGVPPFTGHGATSEHWLGRNNWGRAIQRFLYSPTAAHHRRILLTLAGEEWHSFVQCGTRAADLPRHTQREGRPSEGTRTSFTLASGNPRRSGRNASPNGLPRQAVRGCHQ